MSEPRNTRERIQQVAMELFNQQGYDRTSLREIAERLNVTKAALYYHFKTKEDIAASFFDDFNADVTKLHDWAAAEPRDLETRREILRRYSEVMNTHGPTLRFMHHNQPALREIGKGKRFKERMQQISKLLVSPEASPIERLRGVDAILTMHLAWFVELEGDPDPVELREPALRIALELIEANESEAELPMAGETSRTDSGARATLHRMLPLLRDKNLSQLAEMFAEDGVHELPYAPHGAPTLLNGREAIRDYYDTVLARVPLEFAEFRPVAIHDTADPQVIVAEYDAHGTASATDRSFTTRFVWVLTIADGQILRWRDYMNTRQIIDLQSDPTC